MLQPNRVKENISFLKPVPFRCAKYNEAQYGNTSNKESTQSTNSSTRRVPFERGPYHENGHYLFCKNLL